MFVYNFKINKKKFVNIFTIIIVILTAILLILSFFKIFKPKENTKEAHTNIIKVESKDFTNFLKDCHSNIDKYVGTNITMVGYVYRMPDFTDNQFVLARTMLMNSNNKAVIVGMLCESPEAKNFKDSTWVLCSGIIEKCDYHGEMPILKVSEISNTEIPLDDFVYSPQD